MQTDSESDDSDISRPNAVNDRDFPTDTESLSSVDSGANDVPTLADVVLQPCFMEAMRTVVDVAVECNVPHEKVQSCLRRAFLERSRDLPRFPVIYSVAFGGFGYSKSFKSLMSGDDDRRDAYDEIVAYGKLLCEEMPALQNIRIPSVNSTFNRTKQLKAEHGQPVDDAMLRCSKRPGFSLQAYKSPRPADKHHERIGLVFASGKYADLQVRWVPQLVRWWIGDYDGYESVHW